MNTSGYRPIRAVIAVSVVHIYRDKRNNYALRSIMTKKEAALVRDTLYCMAIELANKKFKWNKAIRNAFNHSCRILGKEIGFKVPEGR